MSWDSHIEKYQSANLKVALLGADGVQWAGLAHLQVGEGAPILVKAFADPQSIFATGAKIAGIKYMATRSDGTVVMLKKGEDWIVARKSAKCLVVYSFKESALQPAAALDSIEKLANYFKGLGY